MLRRIDWKLGDSSPSWSSVILDVFGSGTIQVDTGFDTSVATVSFSRTYLENVIDMYGSTNELAVRVSEVNASGFVVEYENLPATIDLEINYLAM